MIAIAIAIVGVGVGASASAAGADIVGGPPDETIAQAAGPLLPYVSYSGAFANPGDVDYLAFRVAFAGETLGFLVANTTQSCNSPDDDSCPVYATLMDQTNQQVGGDSSSAGTVATAGDTETFSWTFAQTGTYYLLMESNGNLADGQPTYSVGVAVPRGTGGPGGTGAPGGTGGGAGSGPVVNSITVGRRQRGNRVTARVVLTQRAASLSATLLAPGPHGRETEIAKLTRHSVAPRTYLLALALPAFYRRELEHSHRLSLVLETTVTTSSGRRLSYTRRVTLTP
jgi:hypothetical protein